MHTYIDGFVLPVPRIYLDEYKKAAEQVAEIWKAHGALAYFEFVGDDMTLERTKSFMETLEAKADEDIVFGWVVFPSKEIRNLANKTVPADPKMTVIVAPLTDPNKLIFDGRRMVYGGFRSLIQSNDQV